VEKAKSGGSQQVFDLLNQYRQVGTRKRKARRRKAVMFYVRWDMLKAFLDFEAITSRENQLTGQRNNVRPALSYH